MDIANIEFTSILGICVFTCAWVSEVLYTYAFAILLTLT